jgi:hypothetical protein
MAPAALVAVLVCCGDDVRAIEYECRVAVKVTSAWDGQPLGGAVVTIKGGSGEVVAGHTVSADGLFATVLPAREDYTVTIEHPLHRLAACPMPVPPPGVEAGGGAALQVRMAVDYAKIPRSVRVAVLWAYKGSAWGPLEGAEVRLTGEHFETMQATDAGGETIISGGQLVPGAYQVRATKPGFDPASGQVAVPYRQAAGDGERFVLHREVTLVLKPKPRRGVVLEVVRADTDAPLAGAAVQVESIVGGEFLASEATGVDGRTELIVLPPSTPEEPDPAFRIKVRQAGFEEKQEELPSERLDLGGLPLTNEPTPYRIALRPEDAEEGDPRYHFTAAEQAALRRFAEWARARNPEAMVGGMSGRAVWEEERRAPDGQEVVVYIWVDVEHPHHGHDPPEPLVPPDWLEGQTDNEWVRLGRGGIWNKPGAAVDWVEGFMSVHVHMGSRPYVPDFPAPEDALALAKEISRVLAH